MAVSIVLFNTFQLNGANAVQLAQQLCQPFGISVETIGDISATVIPSFAVIMTETAYEIIERVCRFAALLAYDDTNGDLILSRAGTTSMESGFAQGQNVQAANTAFTMDQRYSQVSAVLLSTEFLLNTPADASEAAALQSDTVATANDPGVFRYRPLLIIAEQNDPNYAVTQQRVQWEVNRRWGRSQRVKLICDSWRDSAGTLWTVNALANVNLPALKVTNQVWLISDVSFLRDANGTRAEITLMPQQAFSVEPIVLLNDSNLAVVSAAQNSTGAANSTSGNTAAAAPAPAIPTGGASK